MSWARVVWAWGAQHRPHSVRSDQLAWRAMGLAAGRPRGSALRSCEGRLRPGTCPPPAARPQGALLRSATHLLGARARGRGSPALFLWPASPAGGCVPLGWWEGIPGGWPSIVVRGISHQALSLSWPPVSGGGQPGPVARVSRARVMWVWGTQHRPYSARSCEPALRAVGVAGGRPRRAVPCAVVRGV